MRIAIPAAIPMEAAKVKTWAALVVSAKQQWKVCKKKFSAQKMWVLFIARSKNYAALTQQS